MLIVTANSIFLRPQTFDVEIWIPALEVPRTMLNAPDNIVTVYDSDF
jgi:hypothetical protein